MLRTTGYPSWVHGGEKTAEPEELRDIVARVAGGFSLAPLEALKQDKTVSSMQKCFPEMSSRTAKQLHRPLQNLLLRSHQYLAALHGRLPIIPFQNQPPGELVAVDPDRMIENKSALARQGRNSILTHRENDTDKQYASVQIIPADNGSSLTLYHITSPKNEQNHTFGVTLAHPTSTATGLQLQAEEIDGRNSVGLVSLPHRPGIPSYLEPGAAKVILDATLRTLIVATDDLGY